MIRVLIVDDQPLVRGGIRAALAGAPFCEVCGEAGDGYEAVAMARRLKPDVVLMDVSMPRLGGIDAVRELRADPTAATENVKVLMITAFIADDDIRAALAAGASGIVLKDATDRQIVEAVRTVAQGDAILAPSVTRRLITGLSRRWGIPAERMERFEQLTPRERDVFRLLAAGHDHKSVAALLVLGESTVKSHSQSLYRKLHLRDRVDLVIYAYENGLHADATPAA